MKTTREIKKFTLAAGETMEITCGSATIIGLFATLAGTYTLAGAVDNSGFTNIDGHVSQAIALGELVVLEGGGLFNQVRVTAVGAPLNGFLVAAWN